jgi:tetraacyldisaccharide 4'-kinase
MPLGQLREPVSSISRCDMVVVTKCPGDITPTERRVIKQRLTLLTYQKLFFSAIRYSEPVPVFPVQSPQLTSLQWLHSDDAVLCLTGIATPKPLVRYLRQYAAQVKVMHFDDHHFFTRRDFTDIFKVYKNLTGKRKFIITTEKDAVRIMNNPYYPPIKRNCIYYIPMRVAFLEMEGSDFISELVTKIDEQEEEANLTTMNDNQ